MLRIRFYQVTALGALLLAAGCGTAKVDCSANPVGCVCSADDECGAGNPVCDTASGKCVPCLPTRPGACTSGQTCLASQGSYMCATGCVVTSDCPKKGRQECCNGICADVTSDASNCGTCNNTCPAIDHGAPQCLGGQCSIGGCDDGFADCDNAQTNGCETNLQADIRHCGTCPTVCQPGQNAMATCNAGRCGQSCGAGYADCDGNPVNGCETSTNTDAANCGGCATACAALPNASATVCKAGACAPTGCTGWFADCNGMGADGCESNTVMDASNCGACGKACTIGHGNAACVNGACAVAKCDVGFGDCDGDPANGCEKDVAKDARNCGACNKVCGGNQSVQACDKGVCTVAMCNAGFEDCDKEAPNGCESNSATDIANCGGCGLLCPIPPNSLSICIAGKCGISGCKAGFADCNADGQMQGGNGCEVDITTVLDCGRCGNACVTPNATPACKGGNCAVGMCNAGFADCDMNPATGCEVELAADGNNCGRCYNVCKYDNAQPGCGGGMCKMGACNKDFADCNVSDKDGCEINTSTDANNCGKCGNVCPMNVPFCVNSVCSDSVFPNSLLIIGAQGPQINTWIGKPGVVWKLCYRKSRDGNNSVTFHNLCNNRGETVTVAKLSNNKLLGGYMPVSWNNVNNYIGNQNAFLFSLTNNFKHVAGAGVGGNQYWGYDQSSYGPTFGGGHDWHVPGNMTNGGYCNIGYNYGCRIGSYGNSDCRNDLCGDYSNWQISELEVWYK